MEDSKEFPVSVVLSRFNDTSVKDCSAEVYLLNTPSMNKLACPDSARLGLNAE